MRAGFVPPFFLFEAYLEKYVNIRLNFIVRLEGKVKVYICDSWGVEYSLLSLFEGDKDTVRLVSTVEDCLKLIEKEAPDVVVIRYKIDGISAVPLIQLCLSDPERCNIRFVVLASEESEDSLVDALENGADNYVDHLNSRLPRAIYRTVLSVMRRHNHTNSNNEVQYKQIRLICDKRLLVYKGVTVKLRMAEFMLMFHLVRDGGKLFRKKELASVVNKNHAVSLEEIRVLIYSIRQKAGDMDVIKNRHGIGYYV